MTGHLTTKSDGPGLTARPDGPSSMAQPSSMAFLDCLQAFGQASVWSPHSYALLLLRRPSNTTAAYETQTRASLLRGPAKMSIKIASVLALAVMAVASQVIPPKSYHE